MKFLIKKTYVQEIIALSESNITDENDIPYVMSKKLQNYQYDEIADHSTEITQIYIKRDDQDWELALSTRNGQENNIKDDNY